MDLPVMPPVQPMLAKSVKGVPDPATFTDDEHPGLLFEPKWDGFRCLVFKDGDEVELASRNTKPLTRYFPEVVAALRSPGVPERCVLDGEIVVAHDGRLEFDTLQERIHPAESRVSMLAETTPARYVAFDVLALGDEDLSTHPLAVRRERLEAALSSPPDGVHLTRTTTDRAVAEQWFEQFEGAGLDGVVAKPLRGAYEPNKRAMLKIKHDRTADVVVAGYRLHKNSTEERPLLGSLLLALYDDAGSLRHIGVSASFTEKRRGELYDELQPLVCGPEDHPWGAWSEVTASGGKAAQANVSRWNAGKDLSFQLLRPERVVEVGYDHMEGERFRHTAQFKRWRPDREPSSCTYEQLEEPVSYDLDEVLSG
ncbi:ATP-dependent DNA ligase [Nocardioides sp. HDW12B]|uniref:ATP-dependent DNA ligase n=1 Tax=Nocardioides sp. HDW12B TaxID=2714939 RepID=UPI0014096DEC|nr:ATP-dependent DNA ligase [Nocardioides sp. HDW12B]QIK66208.1 ATP-dependent DNA ligase [Nocardioides sp. HDW12B]